MSAGLRDYNQYGTYYSSYGGQFGKLGVKVPQSVQELTADKQKPLISLLGTEEIPLNKNIQRISLNSERFEPPKAYIIDKGKQTFITNGRYTIEEAGMLPHTNGDYLNSKSQFLFGVDANKATLDAATFADKYNLWNSINNSAKVPISNGNIGVLGRSGELTNYINVYRSKTGFVHSSPGNPPKNP